MGTPWRERLLVGLIFLVHSLPFVGTTIPAFARLVAVLGGTPQSGSDAAPCGGLLRTMVYGLPLFLAGLSLMFRRRLAVALFVISLAMLVLIPLARGQWHLANSVCAGMTLLCIGYAEFLRRRGRLR